MLVQSLPGKYKKQETIIRDKSVAKIYIRHKRVSSNTFTNNPVHVHVIIEKEIN